MKKYYVLWFLLIGGFCLNPSFAGDFSDTLKLAEQGDVDAQVLLATLYEDGDGVEKNLKEAMKWYQQAALQGDSDAQLGLAGAYLDKDDDPQSEELSYMWLIIAELNSKEKFLTEKK